MEEFNNKKMKTLISRIAANLFLWLCFLLITLFASGCLSLYSEKSVDVAVFDEETGRAITNATVSIRYSGHQGGDISFTLNIPKDQSIQTHINGHANVRAACYPAEWRITAPDYLSDSRYNNYEYAGGLNFIPRDFAVANAPAKAQISLYKAPAPIAVIDLPENYHGSLRVIMKDISGHGKIVKGVREFYYAAKPDGWCVIPMNKLFWAHHPQIKIMRSGKIIYPAKRDDIKAFCNNLGEPDTATRKAGISLFTIGSEMDFESLETRLWSLGPGLGRHPNQDAWNDLFGFDGLKQELPDKIDAMVSDPMVNPPN